MTETISVQELALLVKCPRCGAPPGLCCAEALKLQAAKEGKERAVRELEAIARAAPHLAHTARMKEIEKLVDSAEAYGLVKRVPARRRRSAR